MFNFISKATNYFTLIIIIFVGIYVFLSISVIQSNSGKGENILDFEIRIIEVRHRQFDYLHTAIINNEIWHLSYHKNLQIGYNYKIQNVSLQNQTETVKIDEYQLYNTTYDTYYLASNIIGIVKLKNKAVLTKQDSCDYICSLLVFKTNFISNIRFTSQKLSCHNYYYITSFFSKVDCKEVSALFLSLTTGKTDDISKEIKDKFRVLNLSHVIAFSGLQISLIYACVEYILNRADLIKLHISYKVTLALLFISILVLIGFVGIMPPVIRSSLSIFISQFVLVIFGIRLSNWRALTYSAIIILLIFPLYILNISFQLSFLATFTLIIVSNIFDKIWNIVMKTAFDKPSSLQLISKNILQTLFQTLSITMVIMLSIKQLETKITWEGLFANVILVPLGNIATILGYLSFLPIFGSWFYFITNFLLSLFLYLLYIL
jgi:ComEC/Rec2-related protein